MTAYAYALAEMLIRRPVAEVFEAFINPTITTQFWFTHATGRLDEHKEVVWTWEMYKHSTEVKVMSGSSQKTENKALLAGGSGRNGLNCPVPTLALLRHR